MGGGPTEFVGKVVSNRMQKSVLVAIDRMKHIPKYKTSVKRTTKLMFHEQVEKSWFERAGVGLLAVQAHDEKDECNVGDTVRIRLCRPLSKNKSYTVTEVLHRSRLLDMSRVQAVGNAHSFAASGVVAAGD